jgi:hypothetical protein
MEENMIIHKRILAVVVLLLMTAPFLAQASSLSETEDLSNSLLVLWTSGDKEVAQNMVFMYVYNAKKNKWWGRVRLLIWGPSAKLLSEDKDLQASLVKMKEIGVELYACKACADRYGVGDKLTALGVTVKYTGTDLTDWLKAGWINLTI